MAPLEKDQKYQSEERHKAVWDEIFKNYTWLEKMTELGFNPVLVGN